MSTTSAEVLHLAGICAGRLRDVTAADAALLEPAFRELLEAVKKTDARFTFDRDGRPSAIAAVRAALPAIERDLLDAIVEDHACELAALHEAMFQVLRASSPQPD